MGSIQENNAEASKWLWLQNVVTEMAPEGKWNQKRAVCPGCQHMMTSPRERITEKQRTRKEEEEKKHAWEDDGNWRSL